MNRAWENPRKMIDLATNLTQDAAGIWVARNQTNVSYPSEGNENCAAVEGSSYWFRHRNDVITHLVSKLSPKATFFDIGGGNGCVSNALQSAGIDVALLDPGSFGARKAKQRGIKTVIQSTLEDAGLTPNSLPSAGLFDVLEHIQPDVEFLQTIHQYLQPSGLLYLTVPAYEFLWSKDDVYAGHFRRYTTQSLTARLKAAGFTVTFCSYLFSFLVPPIFLLRSIPSRLGLRKPVTAATTEREHSTRAGLAGTVLQKCLDVEFNRIRNGKRIPFGSSCIAVAMKAA